MTDIDRQTPVRDIVVKQPRTRRLLEQRGIDYCCNGQMPLGQAAERAGVDAGALITELREAIESPPERDDERDWSGAPLADLADHIVETHHAFMRRQMPRIDRLLTTVTAAHPPHARMLMALRGTFDRLRTEIDEHLMKEEMVLFPYVRQLDAMTSDQAPFEPMHCGTVANPIRQMEHEHDAAGEALAELRSLTAGYTLPDDACPTFEELYQSLQELEADLHEHIHLENNVLFPRALEAEHEAAAGR